MMEDIRAHKHPVQAKQNYLDHQYTLFRIEPLLKNFATPGGTNQIKSICSVATGLAVSSP